MLTVYDLNTIDSTLLDIFFKKCQQLNYVNNISLDTIHAKWALTYDGNFWFLVKENEIIGMAGCHRFPEIDAMSFRIQYRGCEIPGKDLWSGLSKSYFNSSTFRELVPYQLKWIEEKGYDKNNVYVSANLDNRNHKIITIMEKTGLYTKYKEGIISTVPQTVWKFNVPLYEELKKKVTSYVV
jgi:hypothetical protein